MHGGGGRGEGEHNLCLPLAGLCSLAPGLAMIALDSSAGGQGWQVQHGLLQWYVLAWFCCRALASAAHTPGCLLPHAGTVHKECVAIRVCRHMPRCDPHPVGSCEPPWVPQHASAGTCPCCRSGAAVGGCTRPIGSMGTHLPLHAHKLYVVSSRSSSTVDSSRRLALDMMLRSGQAAGDAVGSQTETPRMKRVPRHMSPHAPDSADFRGLHMHACPPLTHLDVSRQPLWDAACTGTAMQCTAKLALHCTAAHRRKIRVSA